MSHSTDAAPGAPSVPDSLLDVLNALDGLRVSEEGGQQDRLAHIQQGIEALAAENAALKHLAQEAFAHADDLRQENEDLSVRLTQLKTAEMVAQTEQLQQVAYEYDKEILEARVADADALLAEVEELRERVLELEEDNAGQAQMLLELRRDQQQLQLLQSFSAPADTPIKDADGSIGEITAEDSLYGTPNATLNGTPQQSLDVSGKAAPPNSSLLHRTSGVMEPSAVADALTAAAGGADNGVAAAAARMLHEHAATQQALKAERQDTERLRKEVSDLTETMTGKTFKAPSAWAEREVKYKQDKRRWDEAQKESSARLEEARVELEALRTSTGVVALQQHLQELEARLLESERERDALRAALHELQLASRPQAGEFSRSGVAPYSARLPGEVQQEVDKIETSGSTPNRSPRTGASPSAADNVAQQLLSVQRENRHLRTQIEQMSQNQSIMMETPEVVRRVMDVSALAHTKAMKEQLAQAQQEKAAIQAELQDLVGSAADVGTHATPVQLQLNLADAEIHQDTLRVELALLQRGADVDTAHGIAELEAQLRQAAHREQTLAARLQAADPAAAASTQHDKPFNMQIAVVDPTLPPVALQLAIHDDEAASLRQQLSECQREQETAQAKIRELAAAVQAHSPAGGAVAEAISLPIHIMEAMAAPAVDASMPAAPRQQAAPTMEPGVVTRVTQLQSQLETEQKRTEGLQLQLETVKASQHAAGSIAGVEDAGKLQRIKELEELLAQKQLQESRLQADLQAAVPVRLNFAVAAGEPTPAKHGVSRASSNTSLNSADVLARDRAEADAAWEAHVKNSNVPSLLRAKAELEARCQLLEVQVQRMQGELNTAEKEKDLVEESIDSAISTGDVGLLSALREKLRSSARLVPNRRMVTFKRKQGVSKTAMQTALHDTQEALQDSTAERNALRRQLARMSKQKCPATVAEGDHDEQQAEELDAGDVMGEPADAEGTALHMLEDAELELASLREENQMLMDHVVNTKVRLAEVEGDFLEARRALLRAREKQMLMAKQLADMPTGPLQEGFTTPPPRRSTDAAIDSERRRSLRIPGLT